MPTNSRPQRRRRRRPAQQLQLMLGDGDIHHDRKACGVYRDRDARHALVYKISKLKVSFVEMRKGRLVTSALPKEKFFKARGFERTEYPLQTALDQFLEHRSGLSKTAREVLLAFLQEARRDGRVALPLFI